jgi:hypothetical protein
MTERKLRATGRFLSLGIALLLLTSCRDATQLTLHVHTDMPCTGDNPWEGVAVYVGLPGDDVEQTSATLVTQSCDEHGKVGSLVVTPSGDKDGEVGLRVVAGIARAPEKCFENDYIGCIVTRRAVRFSPHQSLELDIELSADCVSVGCDVTRSCIDRRCVDARSTEALPEPEPEPEHSVRCGDDGVRCATQGDVCCLSVDLEEDHVSGDCRPSAACELPSITLHCDDDSDCEPYGREPTSGAPSVCALSYSLSGPSAPWSPSSVALAACQFADPVRLRNSLGLALCQNHENCADGYFPCRESQGFPANPLPRYFWCELELEPVSP